MGSTIQELSLQDWTDTSPSPAREDNLSIAPFLGHEPQIHDIYGSNTPTPQRRFGLNSKASFSTFGFGRNGSTSSTRDRIESYATTSDYAPFVDTAIPPTTPLPPKSPGAGLFNLIKRKKSATRLRQDSHPPLQNLVPPVPHLPRPDSSLSGASTQHATQKSPAVVSKKDTRRKRAPPPALSPQSTEPEFLLDSDLNNMDGIIDSQAADFILDINANGSAYGAADSASSISDLSSFSHVASSSSHGPPIFTSPNPFHRDKKRRAQVYDRKISPKSMIPTIGPLTGAATLRVMHEDPTWKAPESWSVNEGVDVHDIGEPSSDESVHDLTRFPSVTNGNSDRSHRRRSHQYHSRKKSVANTSFKVRIYRANGSYHVASLGLNLTVGQLSPTLNTKLLGDPVREEHRLYLRERGRERILAQTECPAKILKRRLEQAGFDAADGLDELGALDLSYLLKFVYKTQLLGPADESIDYENAQEKVDLAGLSLRTIPVQLYGFADTIVILNISRNPMIEIPLDFIQSCTTLRQLGLSHMAMKKIPASVRAAKTLHFLDISCNRIGDLLEAGLDSLPPLRDLNAQNNRMEMLPWYFPRLKSLKFLNISNNKFKTLPSVVTQMTNLVDLDISFNMIQELPEAIGDLISLEKLVFVGNQITKFPDQCAALKSLKMLDCRRNNISDLSVVYKLPKLTTLQLDHNAVSTIDLEWGHQLSVLDASRNGMTKLRLSREPQLGIVLALTTLDVSHAKLSTLDDVYLAKLVNLKSLKLDDNSFRYIPDCICDLTHLEYLSCSDNNLSALPAELHRLQRLHTLDAHHNSLTEIPPMLWNCPSLAHINITSNLLKMWHDPPSLQVADMAAIGRSSLDRQSPPAQASRFPPLSYSLQRLYVGENNFTDDSLLPFTILRELSILNLSFNNIQEMPPQFFRNLTKLEEVYLSGNKLSSIPTEDLHRLPHLSTLFLNGNRFQTLPHELSKIKNLTVLDVGSNMLKYNINNFDFDWNWNFNLHLKYLNFSGNKKLVIKPDTPDAKTRLARERQGLQNLADFSSLVHLRVLGLMDVTTTFVQNIPEESDTRRIRTSPSEVNRMAYGIADHIGKNDQLTMLDLVQPYFRERKDEAVFAMFGQTQQLSHTSNNRMAMFLHDHFLATFADQLSYLSKEKNQTVNDALRRTFLNLNKYLYDELLGTRRKMSQSSGTGGILEPKRGAAAIVVYFVGQVMYIANAGDALAVLSTNQGTAMTISRKHDPFDRGETARIRAAEGWVNPKGHVNEEVDVSRSFGYYEHLPMITACPDIYVRPLTETDEFVIIANRGLWDYISFQDAVDIARSERGDPMVAAQKLRDFAISYGADGSTMIMVIDLTGIFGLSRARKPTLDNVEPDAYPKRTRARKNDKTTDRNMNRLPAEIDPPTGTVALVFTDIRNSTHLWEVNAGMRSAFKIHNTLLRRQYLLLGGYEVKTEGDAFMVSFPNALSAVWWCLAVQEALLQEDWPLEILESHDGKPVHDAEGKVVMRGISVRMGIHVGAPVCEVDQVNGRMDYFGPMVNRAARICASAQGGQIMCSADVMQEIQAKVLENGVPSDVVERDAMEGIKRIGLAHREIGATKLKGLEIPEVLSALYPDALVGRHDVAETEAETLTAAAARIQLRVEQARQLGEVCLRLEALSTGRIFRSSPAPGQPLESSSNVMYGDVDNLLPPLHKISTDRDLLEVMDSLALRVENAYSTLRLGQIKNLLTAHNNGDISSDIMALLQSI